MLRLLAGAHIDLRPAALRSRAEWRADSSVRPGRQSHGAARTTLRRWQGERAQSAHTEAAQRPKPGLTMHALQATDLRPTPIGRPEGSRWQLLPKPAPEWAASLRRGV